MDIKIIPSHLKGHVTLPPSKSMAHRILLAASLAGKKDLESFLPDTSSISDDINATLKAAKQLQENSPIIDCMDSGTTLRILLPVFAALKDKCIFSFSDQLKKRPMAILLDLLAEGGCEISQTENAIEISGKFHGGTFSLPGNISSQYVSGLLFALPLTDEGGKIILTTDLESRPYVDMTLDVLSSFNITFTEDRQSGYPVFIIPGSQTYSSDFLNCSIEGDWSNGAFWHVANSLGNTLKIFNLKENSIQGDRQVVEILNRYNIDTDICLDINNIPDLVPILAVAAAFRTKGSVEFINIDRLRLKESDRVASTMDLITSLGGQCHLTDTGFQVMGNGSLPGGTVNSYGDHRIAMAAAIAGTSTEGPVIIKNAQCVNKSYPDFFEHFEQLGGKIVKL
ncbi:MAG: 3-phosphoshikimate 1-carboxyvinyltransferase [Eubacterium sp.]|nr:3-phosphoshikimate 1-carboxyvinyltransferase [Eubacterium sp.]